MFSKLVAAFSIAAFALGKELTQENWAEETSGKTVFVKFLAPWCGHCKSMKPAWDKLIKEFEGSNDGLVADVDCTAGGKELCETIGVQGYPTIKWGDPSDLQDYEGGRDLKELKKFAKANLKPMCSPKNLDLCDDDKKKQISELLAMGVADLKKKIDESVQKQTDVEENFKAEVDKLQKRYEQLEKEKTETLKEIKESGLGLMKAVLANRKDKDEL